jgi:hypothetical protein
MTSELIAIPSAAKTAALFPAAELVPALVAAAGERASIRFLEIFAANIRNPHTRRAYARAADEFPAWCASAGVPSIGVVQPVHVATWIEAGTRELAAPSVKQRLAAIRHLQKWQKNQIFEAIQAVGLDPKEFDLEDDDAEIRVKHKWSESCFIIDGDPGHYVGRCVDEL